MKADEGAEYEVLRLLSDRGLTLALAESMTAGGVSARIARVPGASAVLRGAVVVYATPTKVSLAGIEPSILAAHGPVSREVSVALAQAARARLGADVGLSVVGVAGPDEQGGQPVGRVHIACSIGEDTAHQQLDVPRQGRVGIQELAVTSALDFLRDQFTGPVHE